jgi:hypothetical protein
MKTTTIDYQEEVLKVYSDAFIQPTYNMHCGCLPVGCYVCRSRKFLGLSIPFFPIKIGYGWVPRMAWQSAYNELVSQGLITPQTT